MSELENLVQTEEINNQAYNILTNDKKINLTTEIKNPVAISALDTLARLTSNKTLEFFLYRYRLNYVAYQRKRALEIIDVAKADLVRQQEQRNTFLDKMLGR